MLHRYLHHVRMKTIGTDGVDGSGCKRTRRRPHLSTLCDDGDEVARWLRQVNCDIWQAVADIQDVGLDGDEVRDLNDRINKLLRERRHWRRRVVALGGELSSADEDEAGAKRSTRRSGDDVFEHGGVLYFGAAKNLPEVRALAGMHASGQGDENSENEEEMDMDLLNERVCTFYYEGNKKSGVGVNEKEKTHACTNIAQSDFAEERRVALWEEEHLLDDDYAQRYGEHAQFDNSFLLHVQTHAAAGPGDAEREAAVRAVGLERKKAEAVELLIHTSKQR